MLVFLISALIVAIRLSSAEIDTQFRGDELQHANHVFNAILSSMRQFGSSVNHNGMSFFVATVPQGTTLYHGTNTATPINGTEWLAFEPEHGLIFARPPVFPHPPDHGKDPGERNDSHSLRASDPASQTPLLSPNDFDDVEGDRPPDTHGYLHTYKTRHPLRLVYLDGQSAAKSARGTLDTQDVVLLQENPPSRGLADELVRAERLCKVAREEWAGRVHGFVRMEVGFEIILCAFEDHLDVDFIAEVPWRSDAWPLPRSESEHNQFEWYKAAAARFDGIGGRRVALDYESFVTLFATPEAMYFGADGRPRVRNDSALVAPVRQAIRDMVVQEGSEKPTDWQAIADMVVSRYAKRIDFLASRTNTEDADMIKDNILAAVRPFIDSRNRNLTAEIERCTMQFIPRDKGLFTYAAAVVMAVSREICTMFSVASQTEDLDNTLHNLQKLKNWLDWACWKQCQGCGANEVCFVSIWPFGSAADLAKPRCRANLNETHGDYW